MRPEEWIEIRETVQQGDRSAFEHLYNALWSKLYAVAFNYVRQRETAQEMVQDTFVKLWEKREQLAIVNDITAFSMRTLQHRLYNYFDKRAVEERYLLAVSKASPRHVDNPQVQLEYEETYNLITREIQSLPDTTQKVFRLSRFHHFSNEEIAKTLRVSVKTIEYHISQSLKHLRIRLGNFHAISVTVTAALWLLLFAD